MDVDRDARASAMKRGYLIALLCMMGVGTVAAVLGLMVMDRGDQDSVLVSSAGVGFLLLMAFCALAGMERRSTRLVAACGSVMALFLCFAFPTFIFYADRTGGSTPGDRTLTEMFGDVVGTGMVVASFLCLVAFVAAPRLNMWGRMVQIVTGMAMLVAGALLIATLWSAFPRGHDWGDVITGFCLVSAAGVLGVLVLNRFFAIPVVHVVSAIDQCLEIHCPRCRKSQEIPMGESACRLCGLKFKISMEEPLCPKCGYSFRGLTEPVCPECGVRLGEVVGEKGRAAVANADQAALIGHHERPDVNRH